MGTTRELRFGSIRIHREVGQEPEVLLACITPSGQARLVPLDRVDLARLMAQAATANLVLTGEGQ